MMEVTPSLINEGKALDEKYWGEYLFDVDSDDKQYMPFQRWLAIKLHRSEVLLAAMRPKKRRKK